MAAMIFTLRLICLLVNPCPTESFRRALIRLSVNPLIGFMLLPDESWANDEKLITILIKKLNKVFIVQECDANEDELCTEVGFIKNKNTHNRPLLLCWVRFTEKIIRKI